jgi:hypothetical protein
LTPQIPPSSSRSRFLSLRGRNVSRHRFTGILKLEFRILKALMALPVLTGQFSCFSVGTLLGEFDALPRRFL